jgi:hypothetical protein
MILAVRQLQSVETLAVRDFAMFGGPLIGNLCGCKESSSNALPSFLGELVANKGSNHDYVYAHIFSRLFGCQPLVATIASACVDDRERPLDPDLQKAVCLQEFFMYYLARMPADFLEDPTVQAWINHVVENRSLWKQRLHNDDLDAVGGE